MGEKALEIDVDGGLVVVGAELKVNANSRVSHSSLFDYRMSMISCFPPAPPSVPGNPLLLSTQEPLLSPPCVLPCCIHVITTKSFLP